MSFLFNPVNVFECSIKLGFDSFLPPPLTQLAKGPCFGRTYSAGKTKRLSATAVSNLSRNDASRGASGAWLWSWERWFWAMQLPHFMLIFSFPMICPYTLSIFFFNFWILWKSKRKIKPKKKYLLGERNSSLILVPCILIFFLSLHAEVRALYSLKYIWGKCEQVRKTLGAGEVQQTFC